MGAAGSRLDRRPGHEAAQLYPKRRDVRGAGRGIRGRGKRRRSSGQIVERSRSSACSYVDKQRIYSRTVRAGNERSAAWILYVVEIHDGPNSWNVGQGVLGKGFEPIGCCVSRKNRKISQVNALLVSSDLPMVLGDDLRMRTWRTAPDRKPLHRWIGNTIHDVPVSLWRDAVIVSVCYPLHVSGLRSRF